MASATSSTFDSPQLPNLTPDPLPPHFPPLPQQMSRSPSLKPQDSRPSEQSQPMTRNASTSSSSSTKNQDASDSAPYGTRSRSGAGTRPNYADDNELDSAIMSLREDGFSNGKPSTSPEGATKSAGEASQPRGPSTTIKLNIKSGNFPHASQNGFFAANSDQHPRSDGAGPPQPERKKRKYERHQPAKNQAARDSQNGAAAAAATSRDAIPGASQFSAMPNGASEAPPWKRRKTSDGQSHVPYPSARTSSLGHPANQEPRESALVTFESSGYFLKNGELQADNGRSYAPNGKATFLRTLQTLKRSAIRVKLPVEADTSQTMYTSSASHRETLITLRVSWNSNMPIPPTQSLLSCPCLSIGSTAHETSVA